VYTNIWFSIFKRRPKLGKKPTNVQGIYLLKLPASEQSPSSIAIDVNPTNAAYGSSTTTRKKGIIIRDGSELEQFNRRRAYLTYGNRYLDMCIVIFNIYLR
jgi:hypothetical protein